MVTIEHDGDFPTSAADLAWVFGIIAALLLMLVWGWRSDAEAQAFEAGMRAGQEQMANVVPSAYDVGLRDGLLGTPTQAPPLACLGPTAAQSGTGAQP